MKPYYQDDLVTLYHGDCLEITEWLEADVLVTDPPYGRNWQSGSGLTNAHGRGLGSKPHGGIANDDSPAVRDAALAMWGDRPGVVFGDLLIQQPVNAVQCLVYAKAADAGIRGARAGFRRDAEAIYLTGPWPSAVGGDTSILRSGSWVAGPTSPAFRYSHPHAKPVDLLERLIGSCPPGAVADPFAGSGSTLVAARNLRRGAIGVELEEKYCEIAARRLDQMILDFQEGA
ncbi:DNA modification methylase [Mycobacteroides abscessus subsp. bolletii]|nr:DNA modification methylase [Mycobacteroides abscessus subsp. bolletii]